MYQKNVCCIDLPEYPVNELGRPVDEIVVDQYYAQDFMVGENGFCRSDISMMIHTESEELRMAIASKIQEVKSTYPDQDLSDDTLIKLTVPRYVQSEHDFREWASRIDELGFNKAIDEFVKSRNDKQVQPVDDPIDDPIKFDPVDDPKVE